MSRLLRPILVVLLLSAAAVLTTPAAAQSLTVENNATLTIEKDLTVNGTLTAESGTTLEIDNANGVSLTNSVDVVGTLTLIDGALTPNGNLTLLSTGESTSGRISGSGSGSISGDVTAERFIERQDGGADDSHWRMMASPLGGALDEQSGGGGGEHGTYSGPPLLSNTWTQGDGVTGANFQGSGADPSVFFYQEGADVGTDPTQGWNAVDDLTNPTGETGIASQEGFAVFLFQDRDFDGTDEGFPITLSVTGSVPSTENDGTDVSLPVTCTDNDGGSDAGSDGCTDDSDGWNLVANPFFSHFDWTSGSVSKTALEADAYVFDADNDHYDLTDGTNGGDEFIAPFQAFFAKSNATDGNEGNAALTVNSNAKANPSASGDREFKSVADEPLVSLQLTDGTEAEETRVTFRESTAPGKDRYDGYQLTPLSADYHLLASEIEGRTGTYDSQYRPAPSDSLTVDLTVTATASGTYTIERDTLAALPSDWRVRLVDTKTGETADLRAGESISFRVGSSSTALAKEHSPRELLADGPVQKTTSTGVITDRFELRVVPASAIPVELAGFDATAKEREVVLAWQTASEQDNAGFAVERRVEAGERGGAGGWTQVGFVESKASGGTTSEPKRYRFADTEVPFEAEQLTYRLRQKDLDGSTSLSEKVAVDLSAPSETTLHAPFPSPARGQVTLRYEIPESLQGTEVQVALYDVLGRRVRTITSGRVEAGRHEEILRAADLAPGTYFIRLQAGGQVQTRRLTVVR